MPPLDVPERAIRCFERIHGLRITVHDLRGSLAPAIDRDRSKHTHPLCHCVKASGGESECAAFEVVRLRADMHTCPEGQYHVCHAGFVEWVVPVYDNLELEWVLFAGIRTPGPNLSPARTERRTAWARPPWKAGTPMPATVDDAEAETILEHLVQLSIRLHDWAHKRVGPKRPATPPSTVLTRKRTLIRRYVEKHHTGPIRLASLAQELGVTEDRATHLIRECCGQSFRTILLEARLATAKELLRFSSMPILEVALSSGFPEVSYFNRIFRAKTGMTPGAFRKQF